MYIFIQPHTELMDIEPIAKLSLTFNGLRVYALANFSMQTRHNTAKIMSIGLQVTRLK